MSRLNPSILLLINFVSSGLFAAVYHQAARHCDKSLFLTTVGLVTLLSTVPLFWWQVVHDPTMLDFLFGRLLGYWILLIVPLLGALFAMHSYSRLRVSEALPTYVHLPLQRVQLLLVILGAFLLFDEWQSAGKLVGIAVAFVPILISVARKGVAARSQGNITPLPIFWLVAVVLLGALLQLSSKLALHRDYSIAVPALIFVILSNVGSTIVAVGANLHSSVKIKEAHMTIALGVLGGVLNVGTFVTLTQYLVIGDASIIYTTNAMGFLVPTALYQFWGTEAAPTKLDWVAYGCAVFAVITLIR
jgi:hypothetical protein